jgi:hypothetical protein
LEAADVFGSDILEVAIGIVFIFLIISIVCAAIREGLESILKTRAAYLEAGIREMLGDRGGGGLAAQIYAHPIVSGLFSEDYRPPAIRSGLSWLLARGRNLPSYIPSRNFALALMDLAARGPTNAQNENRDHIPLSIETLRRNLPNVQNPAVKRVLLTALDSSNGDLDNVRQTIQAWYDSSMDRISGWYKRSTQWIIFGIGVVVAVSINVDTIDIAKFLYTNKAARAAIVADAAVAAADTAYLHQGYQQARARITDESLLPVGWRNINTPGDVLHHILGWLVTALASTMGAPFWFDLLNKMMVIRSTVKPHEKSPEEASEDRQTSGGDGGGPGGDSASKTRPVAAVVPVGAASGTGVPHPHDNDEDACDVDFTDITTDEELPEARGGVATS